MSDFITAIGLVLVIEGVLYALFPVAMKKALHSLLSMPDASLRNSGLGAIIIGVAVVWVVRH